jgi:STE24 endopeptidase
MARIEVARTEVLSQPPITLETRLLMKLGIPIAAARRMRTALFAGLALGIWLASSSRSPAPTANPPTPPPQSAFNIETASRAYLDRLTPEKKHKSDAYFEGGYWIQLWDFLCGTAVAVLLLGTRLSARMRNLAGRVTCYRLLHTVAYWIQYVVVTAVLLFPFTVYVGFFREHQYDMSNQNFGGWFGDFLKGLLVTILLGSLALVPIFALVRRSVGRWQVYASGVLIVFMMFVIVIGPVFIAPLFNKYTPLADAKVREPILSLARANGIPATEVFEMDASRQTKRISANVSGALGTTRVTLNDNLLNRCTLPEIEAVMGHEMGHYVLNHVYKGVLF